MTREEAIVEAFYRCILFDDLISVAHPLVFDLPSGRIMHYATSSYRCALVNETPGAYIQDSLISTFANRRITQADYNEALALMAGSHA